MGPPLETLRCVETLGWAGPSLGGMLDAAPVAAFTAIPEIDLARWTGSEADRVGAGRRGPRRLPRGRVLLPRRPRRHRAASATATSTLLEAFFALPEDVKADDRQVALAALPRLGAGRRRADRQPHRLPRAARRVDRAPALRRRRRPPYLRLDGPNQWLPDDVLPGFRARRRPSSSTAWAPSPIELMGVMSVGLGLDEGHLGAALRRAAAVASPS